MPLNPVPLADECCISVVSWNINGLRALTNLKSIKDILDDLSADIICFQETKLSRSGLDCATACVDGYNAYFSFSKQRTGYAGVVTYCKNRVAPFAAEDQLTDAIPSSYTSVVGEYPEIDNLFFTSELRALETEGRSVLTKHKFQLPDGKCMDFVVVNVYCPRHDPDKPERLNYKLNFYLLLEKRIQALRKAGNNVVLVGDLNTSHKALDVSDPDTSMEEFNASSSRQWMNKILENPSSDFCSSESICLVDTFRHFHPTQEKAFTCWSTRLNNRINNYGCRLDYIIVNREMLQYTKDSVILPDVHGSDHCPVKADFALKPVAAPELPSMCAKFMPEFAGGKQQNLLKFMASATQCSQISKVSSVKQQLSKKVTTPKQSTITTFFNRTKTDVANSASASECSKNSRNIDTSNLDQNVAETSFKVEVDTVLQQSENKSEYEVLSGEFATNIAAAAAWKEMLRGPEPPPLCKGHSEPCVRRVSKRKGNNWNRQFWTCARPGGHKDDLSANCGFFKWAKS